MKVALVVKDSPTTRERDLRNMGYWSYSVPDLEWDHYSTRDLPLLSRSARYDIVVIEDVPAQVPSRWSGPPLIYVAIDSTLSDRHYEERLETARKADCVLVDHDRLERFYGCRRVERWNYCVNNLLFKPQPKSVDIMASMGIGMRWFEPPVSQLRD